MTVSSHLLILAGLRRNSTGLKPHWQVVWPPFVFLVIIVTGYRSHSCLLGSCTRTSGDEERPGCHLDGM